MAAATTACDAHRSAAVAAGSVMTASEEFWSAWLLLILNSAAVAREE